MTATSQDPRIRIEKEPDEKRLSQLGVRSWPIWTKEVSRFDWHYDSNETCYFLEGHVVVKTDKGETRVGKGDLVIFPQGLTCVWDVREPIKKHYFFE